MLPLIDTLEAYRPIYRDAATWLPALQAICRRHALNPDSLRQAPPGSNVVFWVDPDCLVKLFAPMWAADAAREASVLRSLSHGQVDVPRIVAESSLEGWPYLIITRLPGQPLDEIWPELELTERLSLAADLGRLMAALHRVSTSGLALPGADWHAFLRSQVQNSLAQQQAAGSSPGWLAQLAAFLNSLPPLVDTGFRPVLLHADLNPEHLFCTYGPTGWRITGMIDFGDAMLGHPCYEFVAPGFLFGRSPDLRRAMLLAYGYQPADLNEALSHRMMAYTLLHRFASLPEMLGRFEEGAPETLAELQAALWAFG